MKDKKEDSKKPEDKKTVWPGVKGKFFLQAKKGIQLPFRYGAGIAKVGSKKGVELNWESLPYESQISIKKSYEQGHVFLLDGLKGDK